MRAAVDRPLLCPIMVGRDRQMQVLVHLFAQTCSGRPRFALISGEAGIGKSRLVREALAALQAPARVVQGCCYELDQRQPYAPLLEILRSVQPFTDTPQEAALLAEVTRLLPGLDTDTPMSDAGEAGQRRLAQAMTELFEVLARAQPLVIIIEDLHWCDDATLAYLSRLAQRVRDQALLVVLTWRSEEVTPALMRALATIERTRLATELALAPLNLEETKLMLAAMVGQGSAGRAHLVTTLYALTEGSPFFVEELVKSIVSGEGPLHIGASRESSAQQDLRLPHTVQAAVRRRVEMLSPAAGQLLTLAAVLGRRCDFTLLEAMTGLPEEYLFASIRELIGAQLLIEEGPDSIAFRHALTRQAVYNSLLLRERRAFHRAIAQSMEQFYSDKRLEPVLNDLAYHCYWGELWAKALEYSTQAGHRAQSLHSPTTAVDHYTTALLAARRLAEPIPVALFLARGKMFELLGEFEAARADFEQAVETARHVGDIAGQAQGLLDLGFLWTARDYDKAGAYFREGAARARAADNDALLAEALNRLGMHHTHAERPHEGQQHHQVALSIYRWRDDSHGVAATLDLLGVTAYMAGDLATGWRYFEEAIALCRATDQRGQLATLLLTASVRGGALLVDTLVTLQVAPYQGVAECEEAISIARAIHTPAMEAYARILLAEILGWHGDFERALGEAEQALAIAQEIGHTMWRINALNSQGLLYLELGNLATAHQVLEQAIQELAGIHSLYLHYKLSSALCRVHVAAQQTDQAGDLLDRIITPDLPMQSLAQRMVWAAQAERELVAARPEQALVIVERLITTAANRAPESVIPRLWHLRGQALAGLHRMDEATEALQAGLSAAVSRGNRPMAWRLGAELSRVYLAQHRYIEAQRVATATQSLVAQLGSELSAGARREQFVRYCEQTFPRIPPTAAPKDAPRASDELTRREREIARLIAQGQTNPAIARDLVLSERTVEKHVENILGKLGFKTRTQIAVWAVDRHLDT